MKTSSFILSAILASLICISSLGANTADYENALRTARSQGKPLLLYFYSKTCPYCKMMEKNTLADKEIDTILKKQFVFLRIDADNMEDLARFYDVRGYPTSWFVEPAGKRIVEAPGYIEKPLYRKILEYVKGNHYKNKDINDYLKLRK